MTNVIKLTHPVTGRVRSKDAIKADPECKRSFFHGDDLTIMGADDFPSLMVPRAKNIRESSYGYGKTLAAMSAIAQARLNVQEVIKSAREFSKTVREINNDLINFWSSPIETTYLQHHQHLPGRKGNARQRKKAFKRAEHWYYNVYLKCEVSQ